MRLKLALLAAKFTAFMLKVFGRLLHFNGTYFPGKVALKICPDFLKRVAKPKTVIAVTGTDGKTTTCTLTSHILNQSKVGCSAFLGGISKNFDKQYIKSIPWKFSKLGS